MCDNKYTFEKIKLIKMLNKHKRLLNEISLQNYPDICIELVIEFSSQIWLLILVNSPEK